MTNHETLSALGLLLHCAHSEERVSTKTTVLLYAGIRVLMAAGDAVEPPRCNEAFWHIYHRLEQGHIRIEQRDPLSDPPRRVPLVKQVLAIPNTTSLTSSSKLVKAANDAVGWGPLNEPNGAKLGWRVSSDAVRRDRFDVVMHLVCRTPGDPIPKELSECLGDMPCAEEVTIYTIPLFGPVESWTTWRDAILVWEAHTRNLQQSHAFLDLCFIDETRELAEKIGHGLADCGVKAPLVLSGHQ